MARRGALRECELGMYQRDEVTASARRRVRNTRRRGLAVELTDEHGEFGGGGLESVENRSIVGVELFPRPIQKLGARLQAR